MSWLSSWAEDYDSQRVLPATEDKTFGNETFSGEPPEPNWWYKGDNTEALSRSSH
jgi:hypothetical protein